MSLSNTCSSAMATLHRTRLVKMVVVYQFIFQKGCSLMLGCNGTDLLSRRARFSSSSNALLLPRLPRRCMMFGEKRGFFQCEPAPPKQRATDYVYCVLRYQSIRKHIIISLLDRIRHDKCDNCDFPVFWSGIVA